MSSMSLIYNISRRVYLGGSFLLVIGGMLTACSFSPLSSDDLQPTATVHAVFPDVDVAQPTQIAVGQPTLTPSLPPTPAVITSSILASTGMYTLRQRFGLGIPLESSISHDPALGQRLQQLGVGWYLTWRLQSTAYPPDIEFAPMIRFQNDDIAPPLSDIAGFATKFPGLLWLVANEPDVKWQDNVLPADYARLYHDTYVAIKTADPTAKIAVGGISQITPLRLRYLENILQSYYVQFSQPMPVDIWNIHLFILREERDSWGVDIPPGFDDVDAGTLFEIDDSANFDQFRQQIITFRRWMAARGETDKPLIVSEYGILMPPEYGFDVGRVSRFMTQSFDFMLTATDDEIGYAPDDYRLVQRWVWFSYNDNLYPTGNLVDVKTGKFTPLGYVFAEYVQQAENRAGEQ